MLRLHFRAPRQSTVSCGPSWPRYLGARGSASLPEDEAVEQGDEADRALPPSRSAREPGSLSPVFGGQIRHRSSNMTSPPPNRRRPLVVLALTILALPS